ERMKTPPLFPDDAFGSTEAFLDTFARSVAGLVAYVDTQERILFVSETFAQWFETTRGALLGRGPEELYGAEYPPFPPHLKRALAGEDVHYEREAKRPNGDSFWISVNLRPHRDTEGRVLGVFSCALEVKVLKWTHDALRRALEEIATHMENTPLGVVEWSSELRVKRWSPQAEAIFGWSAAEALGKTTLEIGI